MRFFLPSLFFLVLLNGLICVGAAANPRVRIYRQLLATYSPVWVQEIDFEPTYDVITRFDFDGDKSGFNNVPNAGKYPLPAIVYGEVVAETDDAYYLFYGVYHIRDYDRPLREFFFSSASHDNDYEGLMEVVGKPTGEILAVETWFHSKFLQFAESPDRGRSQTIDGKIHTEDETHPIILVQSRGHGVRAFQNMDEEIFHQNNFKIYRLGHVSTDLRTSETPFVDYTLLPLTDFLLYARGPFDEQSMFAAPQDFGIGERPIGKYLSGRFKGDSSMARPKPPWSWTDKFDTLRPGAWFFHPAYVFHKHFRYSLSERYLYNLPMRALLRTSQKDLDQWVLQKVPSYFNDRPKGVFRKPLNELKAFLYNVADYLFYLLG